MDCFNPSTASGGFTLFACVVCLGLGAFAYRWLMRNRLAELQEAERKLAEFDDARRGL
jgi:hypothetical protein